MAESIVCPVCGETNPGDMEFCRNCQSRLRPLTGALKGESAPIQPGEPPTKKVTSELEPLLPQWLRDARQQARDTAAEDASRAEQEQREQPPASAPDLLDGLASQRDEEDEEIPDWLAQITGAKSRKKKPASEDNQVKWVELGRDREQPPSEQPAATSPEIPTPQPRPSERDELSDWFKQAAASSGTSDFGIPTPPEATPASAVPQEAAPEPERPAEDLDWLTSLDAGTGIPSDATTKTAPLPRDEVPDWLKKLEADRPTPPSSAPAARTAPLPPADVPDWLRHFEEPTSAPPAEPTAPPSEPAESGVPDWLSSLPPAASEIQPPPSEPPAQSSHPAEAAMPDWLSALPHAASEIQPPQPEPAAEEPIIPTEMPDWLSSLPSQQEPPQSPEREPTPGEPVISTDMPDWISSLPSQQEAAQPAEQQPAPEEAVIPTELPDWLSAFPPQQEAPQPPEAQPADQTIQPAELPDWISQLGAAQSPAVEQPSAAEPEAPPAQQAEAPVQETPAPGPALTPGVPAGEDVDSVFASMQTPDWLSAVLPTVETPGAENPPAAAQEAEEPISPAELPSWVQAMRPVESAMAAGTGAEEDISTEKRGPLAGLHGVLPTIPGAGEPSSKPKSYSIKLNASEQQLAHAALLERILAAETAPVPMKLGGLLPSQRILRWVVTALLLLALGAIVFGGTQNFALPTGVPNETVAAISAVEAIPADAPVLVVFDYQPSTIGEMEAAGGPLLDHLLLLNPHRLALLSTSPTGSALAERFMTKVLSSREQLQPGQQYVNLGFLPGGLAGVYSFAQSPTTVMPLDAQRQPAWQSSFLAPVRNLSDFAAIIVLTDTVESGQTWIEQTALARGKSMMILVASAQAGPMLLPYVDSGQVNGMVSGIYGAVGVDQRNAGSPACIGRYDYTGGSAAAQQGNASGASCVRRYWDAYSVGLYLAVALITLGALWNLALGIRERRAQAVG